MMRLKTISYLTVGMLSAATLVFEINLTRLFSVTQFYHFAFMIVSLALLGVAASGTVLAIFTKWGRSNPAGFLAPLSASVSGSILASYLIINWLPFDSYSITWDARQVMILAFHFVVLAAPFFFGSLLVGLLIDAYPDSAPGIYAFNLLGSASGCLLALLLPALLGGEGVVLFSSGLAALGGIGSSLACFTGQVGPCRKQRLRSILVLLVLIGLVCLSVLDFSERVGGRVSISWFNLQLSPYKSLSYALQYPGAEIVSTHWNAFSRVDLVCSGGVRSLPGLSYRYPGSPPPQMGLLVDGDDLSPVLSAGENLGFAAYLPQAVVYQMRPAAEVLVLEARGGLDVWAALALGAKQIMAVEPNPLVVKAAGDIYHQPGVNLAMESGRSFINRCPGYYDIVAIPLTHVYRPITSGAYSLSEDYMATVQAMTAVFRCLTPNGILVITRWLQSPPSEELRTYALLLAAMDKLGLDPSERVVAFRGYNTATFLAKTSQFSDEELTMLREYTSSRAYDLIAAPGIKPDEINRYNILSEPVYYIEFQKLMDSYPRDVYYNSYAFDIHPPLDDRPFFGHFFKWGQAPLILETLGKTWQPFGGAGYFVLIIILGIIIFLSGMLVVLPLIIKLRPGSNLMTRMPHWRRSISALFYFCLLGLGFMLVEIPLIQHFILYLGHPAYALSVVLFSLLLFSGLGSRVAHRLPLQLTLMTLILVIPVLSLLLPFLFNATLGLGLMYRVVVGTAVLSLPGFLMGSLFPNGIRMLHLKGAVLIPWAWGSNGAASVISSVLAAILALSFGFQVVLYLGAACYLAAWLMACLSGWIPCFGLHR